MQVAACKPFDASLQPCSQETLESSVYAARQDKPVELPTFERVFAHSETVVSHLEPLNASAE